MVDFQTDKYFVFTLSFNVKDIVVFSFKSIASTIQLKSFMGHRTKRFFQWSGKMGERF